jgi:hypothetical protein
MLLRYSLESSQATRPPPMRRMVAVKLIKLGMAASVAKTIVM